jgi:hypothetical protein
MSRSVDRKFAVLSRNVDCVKRKDLSFLKEQAAMGPRGKKPIESICHARGSRASMNGMVFCPPCRRGPRQGGSPRLRGEVSLPGCRHGIMAAVGFERESPQFPLKPIRAGPLPGLGHDRGSRRWRDASSEDKTRRHRRAAAAAVGACGVRDAAKERAGVEEAAPKMVPIRRNAAGSGRFESAAWKMTQPDLVWRVDVAQGAARKVANEMSRRRASGWSHGTPTHERRRDRISSKRVALSGTLFRHGAVMNATAAKAREPRRSGAAKRRFKQAVRSSRPDGLRSCLGWLLPPSAACLSVSAARQSATSFSSRAPPKTKTRRRAERTGPATAGLDPQRGAIRQPASPRRAGGATDDRAHAGGGSAGTRLPRRSFAKAEPACRA